MTAGPLPAYRALADAGAIEADREQLLAAEKLQVLANRLAIHRKPRASELYSFFTRRKGSAPEGLYMFGGVGRGKTMLMDLFFDTVAFAPKRRIHFHEFMTEFHDTIADYRKSLDGDPIPAVAKHILSEAGLLCFDELHVTDIADAMILGRLFSRLFEAQLVIVATSNVPPRELYKNGLNRQLFAPFIELIEDRMELFALDAGTDYRLEKFDGHDVYFTPAGEKARRELDAVWQRLIGRRKGAPCTLKVRGRALNVPEAAMGAARFPFSGLCEQPLGAADYLALAHAFHTVLIDDIPVMGRDRRDAARRFNTLIDTLYDNGIRLVASAAAEPDRLYPEGDGAFLFERTASRLIEMRSRDYLAGRKTRSPSAAG